MRLTKYVVVLLIMIAGIALGRYLAFIFPGQDIIVRGDFTKYLHGKPAIYVIDHCSACDLALTFIRKKQLDIEVRKLDSKSKWQADMLELSMSDVPVLIYPDRMIIGFSERLYE